MASRQSAEADAIVIGSGPCGASAARSLAERGLSTIVLERGDAMSPIPGAHLRNDPQWQRKPDAYFTAIAPYLSTPCADEAGTTLPAALVSHAVGGQGILWTNNCPRSVPGLERWPGIDDAEWDRLYDTAERYLSVEPARSSRRQARIHVRLADSLPDREIRDQPFAGRSTGPNRTWYAAPADILAPVGDLVTVTPAQVERVVIQAGRVAGVETTDGTMTASRVIVAAGALDTPRLLHRSGIESSALGRWLTYHELVITQVVLDDVLVTDDDVDDVAPRLMIPPDTDHPWHVMVLRDTNPLAPEAPDLQVDGSRLVEVQAFCPIDPMSRNRIIPDSGEVLAEPSPQDVRRLHEMQREVASIVSALGRSRRGCEPQRMPAGAHVMGTVRMGDDPSSSVADDRGRVHGVDGLWLSTVGLIPSRMAVNPTLTGVALAVRAAEDVAGAT